MKLSEMLKNVRKSNGSKSAADSHLFVDEWISSGSYAVNRAITGDIYKGFPQGRISVVYGDSGSGKSFIVANTIIDALNNNKVDQVFFVDTEGGGLWKYIQSQGVDLSKIEYSQVASVDECKKTLTNIYDTLDKAMKDYEEYPDNNDKIRAFVVLDSFGMLASDKAITDITEKDKVVGDMGVSAKSKNELISILMMRVVRTNTALIIVNHTYNDPSAFYPTVVKPMPGGKKLEYASEVKLQMSKKDIKESDAEIISGYESVKDCNGRFKGTLSKLLCTKNRNAKPGYECEMFISFDHGIQKWAGLVEDAIAFGYITKERGGYVVPSYSDKKVSYKDLITKDEIWKTFVEDFNKESVKKMEYSNKTSEEIEKLQKEIKES